MRMSKIKIALLSVLGVVFYLSCAEAKVCLLPYADMCDLDVGIRKQRAVIRHPAVEEPPVNCEGYDLDEKPDCENSETRSCVAPHCDDDNGRHWKPCSCIDVCPPEYDLDTECYGSYSLAMYGDCKFEYCDDYYGRHYKRDCEIGTCEELGLPTEKPVSNDEFLSYECYKITAKDGEICYECQEYRVTPCGEEYDRNEPIKSDNTQECSCIRCFDVRAHYKCECTPTPETCASKGLKNKIPNNTQRCTWSCKYKGKSQQNESCYYCTKSCRPCDNCNEDPILAD